jgi:hypothetical protein
MEYLEGTLLKSVRSRGATPATTYGPDQDGREPVEAGLAQPEQTRKLTTSFFFL